MPKLKLHCWVLLCFIVASFNIRAWAGKYFYLEQNSLVSGKTKIYYNDKILIFNMPQLKIFVIAYPNNNDVIVVNTKDKLYYQVNYTRYQGNFAQRSANHSLNCVKASDWKNIASKIYDNLNCLKLVKYNLAADKTKPTNPIALSSELLKDDLDNFYDMECLVIKNKTLSLAQSTVIGNVFGLKKLNCLPITACINYNDGKNTDILTTSKKQEIDSDIESRISYTDYKKVTGEIGVYDLKTNLSSQLKDFLDIR